MEGEHKTRLQGFNGSQYEEFSKTFTLQALMHADFSYAPSAVDQDWEAPLTLVTKHLTKSGDTAHLLGVLCGTIKDIFI